MPSIAQVEYEPVCGKKRRWEDNGSESGSNLKITRYVLLLTKLSYYFVCNVASITDVQTADETSP